MTNPARHSGLFLLCCLAPLALAQGTEPYHIKADVLGETVEAYRQNHQDEKQDCVVSGKLQIALVPSVKMCTTLGSQQSLTYAEQPSDGRLVSFNDGKLFELTFTFDSSWAKEIPGFYYSHLLSALTDKFGKPTDVEDSDFANLTGGHLPNQKVRWKNGVSTIEMSKLVSNPYTTVLMFSLDAAKEDARRKILASMKPKSDM